MTYNEWYVTNQEYFHDKIIKITIENPGNGGFRVIDELTLFVPDSLYIFGDFLFHSFQTMADTKLGSILHITLFKQRKGDSADVAC